MKERIIRLLGGCTSEEAIESNGNMRQNNGESPDVWCKNVWQYVCDEIDKLTNQE